MYHIISDRKVDARNKCLSSKAVFIAAYPILHSSSQVVKTVNIFRCMSCVLLVVFSKMLLIFRALSLTPLVVCRMKSSSALCPLVSAILYVQCTCNLLAPLCSVVCGVL